MQKLVFLAVIIISISAPAAEVSRRGFLMSAGAAAGTTLIPCNQILAAAPAIEASPISEQIWLQIIRFVPYRATNASMTPFYLKKVIANSPLAAKLVRAEGTEEQKTKYFTDYLTERRAVVDRELPKIPLQLVTEMNLDLNELKSDIEFFWSISSNYGSLDTYARLDGRIAVLERYIEAVRAIEPNILMPLIDVKEWFETVNDVGFGWRDRYVYEAYEKIGFDRAGPLAKAAIERYRDILALPTREERELGEFSPHSATWSESERESHLQMLRARYALEEERAKHPVRPRKKLHGSAALNIPNLKSFVPTPSSAAIESAPKLNISAPLQLTYQPETSGVQLSESKDLTDDERELVPVAENPTASTTQLRTMP